MSEPTHVGNHSTPLRLVSGSGTTIPEMTPQAPRGIAVEKTPNGSAAGLDFIESLSGTLDPDAHRAQLAQLRAADTWARRLLIVDSPFSPLAERRLPVFVEELAIARFDGKEP